jgi:hypothetical protein
MRHPLHSLCPYFAMFPEEFVAKQVLAYTQRGDVVFDPFCGRGTTVFESLLNGRQSAGVDINPVAACVAGAKADPPTLSAVASRLTELEEAFQGVGRAAEPPGEFFKACFHERTLQEILFLRGALVWRQSRVDRFIAAVALGCLHGESHKSQNCLSNRMPRTISTKPDYSVRWWSERELVAPERATFEILRRNAAFRLSHQKTPLRGAVRLRDARTANRGFPKLYEAVQLIVTSPPYLDTTDYSEDQWLRLWFLGGAERPLANRNRDHSRHTNIDLYWQFLAEAWLGCAPLVWKGTALVVRIGGTHLAKKELFGGLSDSLRTGFEGRRIKPLHDGTTTEIKNRQTNVFRPGTSSQRFEHDFAFQLT